MIVEMKKTQKQIHFLLGKDFLSTKNKIIAQNHDRFDCYD